MYIDDDDPQVHYTGADWDAKPQQRTEGTGTTVHVAHAYPASLSLQFTGTGVNVIGFVNVNNIIHFQDLLTCTVDGGQPVVPQVTRTDGDEPVTFCSISSLQNQQHTLIVTIGLNGLNNVLIDNFHTLNDSPPPKVARQRRQYPTTSLSTPTTQETTPTTTQEITPTTQEITPTTQEITPTTQEITPVQSPSILRSRTGSATLSLASPEPTQTTSSISTPLSTPSSVSTPLSSKPPSLPSSTTSPRQDPSPTSLSQPRPTVPPSASPHIAIIGSIVGGVVLLLAVISLLLCRQWKRRKHKEADPAQTSEITSIATSPIIRRLSSTCAPLAKPSSQQTHLPMASVTDSVAATSDGHLIPPPTGSSDGLDTPSLHARLVHGEVLSTAWYAPTELQSRAQSLLRGFSTQRRTSARRDVDSGLRVYDEPTLPPPYTPD